MADLRGARCFASGGALGGRDTFYVANPLAVNAPLNGIRFEQGQPRNEDMSQYGEGFISMLLAQGPLGLPPGVTYNGATQILSYDGRDLGLAPSTEFRTPGHTLVVGDSNPQPSAIGIATPYAKANLQFNTQLAANGSARASASASLTTSIHFFANARASASASAMLVIGPDILANARASASATADLTTSITFFASAVAQASASANMGIPAALEAAARAGATAVVDLTVNKVITLGTLSAAATVADLIAAVGARVMLGTLTAVGSVRDLVLPGVSIVVQLGTVSAAGSVRNLILPGSTEPLIDEDILSALGYLFHGNVYPMRRPQRESAAIAQAHLPECVYTIVSDDWEMAETLCGTGLHMVRVQLDVYALDYREARAYAYAVAKEMDRLGWRINMQPFPDDDEKITRWQLEYSCGRNEAPPTLPLKKFSRR